MEMNNFRSASQETYMASDFIAKYGDEFSKYLPSPKGMGIPVCIALAYSRRFCISGMLLF